MKKRGNLRAIRNLASGWITHANHGRDRSEMWFHWLAELLFLVVAEGLVAILGFRNWVLFVVVFVAIHTLWWVVNGNFHVYMLDSFRFVRNAGIEKELWYIRWASELFNRNDVKAMLVYGSFCRREFHGRSDLDLRVIRDTSSSPLTLFVLAVYARLVSLIRGCPTDLQIVDSEDFLLGQMNPREIPVLVLGGKNLHKIKVSMSIEDVYTNTDIVMKPEREFEGW